LSTHYDDNPSPPPATVTQLYGDPPYPMLPNLDARTHALRVLKAWFSSLVFRRTMMEGQEPQAFSVTPDRVFVEQPDSVENLQFPSIGILPARGQYYTRGIGGADPDGETAEGYSLLVPYDYQEMLTVEVMGSKIAERRAMVAGIEAAMGSYEGTTDLRLVMSDYFGLAATFSLMERENLEDVESPRGRRRAHLYIQMLVPVVTQARLVGLQANINVDALLSVGADVGVNFFAPNVMAAGLAFSGVQALSAMGLTLVEAKTIARATLGINRLQADALSIDYLVALMQSLAAQNANLRTATTP
jgi:hypothetical protein